MEILALRTNVSLPGITGDIKDTVKITLSPEAQKLLFSSEAGKCSWPALDTNGIFFTFANLDHDKVTDHAPPYHGVWLQRDDDLIVESPMIADRETLNVTAGHSYFLRDGVIARQAMDNACKCDDPETHDIRVRGVLQLSRLLEEGKLILLPHPLMANLGWYVVIAGSEGTSMIPKVLSVRRIIRAINRQSIRKRPTGHELQ